MILTKQVLFLPLHSTSKKAVAIGSILPHYFQLLKLYSALVHKVVPIFVCVCVCVCVIISKLCYLLNTREGLEAEIAQLSHKIDSLGARLVLYSVCDVHTLATCVNEDHILRIDIVICWCKFELFCTWRGDKGLVEKGMLHMYIHTYTVRVHTVHRYVYIQYCMHWEGSFVP